MFRASKYATNMSENALSRTADGYRMRVLINRPFRFGEAWVNGRTMDYNLSALEMREHRPR